MHRTLYFQKCDAVVKKWREAGPKPLNEGGWDNDGTPLQDQNNGYNSGIWLFTDRENITHFFQPNFLPPYNTPEKKKIIKKFLAEEWDQNTLSWKTVERSENSKKSKGLGALISSFINIVQPQPLQKCEVYNIE